MRKGRGRARVERVLGPASSIEVVLEGLLVEEGELRGFEPYDPPAIDPTGRVDLRDRLAFTIDPDTAKDFDDALTVEEDRAFVHIADVSWFVQAGHAARPRRRRAGVLGLRAGARLADAAARAVRGALLAAAGRRPALRDRRVPARTAASRPSTARSSAAALG